MVNGTTRTARDIWQTALGQLQLQVNATSFVTFLKETSGGDFDGSCFTVVAPNAFAREYLDGRLSSTIKRTLVEIVGGPLDVRFIVRSDEPSARLAGSPLEDWAAAQPLATRRARLNPRYTFSSFIIGAGNRFAHCRDRARAREGVGGAGDPRRQRHLAGQVVDDGPGCIRVVGLGIG